jgi:hypothetical protein
MYTFCVAAPQAILGATQRSFAAMKRRLGSKATTGIFYMERPFFNVDVELKVMKQHWQTLVLLRGHDPYNACARLLPRPKGILQCQHTLHVPGAMLTF